MRAVLALLLYGVLVVPAEAVEDLRFSVGTEVYTGKVMGGALYNMSPDLVSLSIAELNHRDDCQLAPRKNPASSDFKGEMGTEGELQLVPIELRPGDAAWLDFKGSSCASGATIAFHLVVEYFDSKQQRRAMQWDLATSR